MNEVIVVSPDQLQMMIRTAVENGISCALANVQKKYGKEMNEKEAGEYINISPQTLRIWRAYKKGPKYHKNGRRVSYSRKDLDEWLKSNEVHTIDSLELRHEICG